MSRFIPILDQTANRVVKIESKKLKLISLSCLVIVLAIGSLSLLRSYQQNRALSKGFPVLLPGAFVGTIDLSSQGEKQQSSLYVERLKDGNTLLFVIFLKDFQPQTIFAQKLSESNAGEQERYRPVTLFWNDQKLVLSGVEENGSFKGNVKVAGQSSGSWSIRRMTPEETMSTSLGNEEEKILIWLKAKEQLRKNTLEKNLLSQNLAETTQKVRALEEALGDKQLLQSRSIQRRKDLEADFIKLKDERLKRAEELESLENSLDLLTRITKRGQAVSLERKILQRENRWYNVHWQGEEDTEELSEEESGIDMIKLENAMRKARETKSFVREKEDELQKIQELTDELNNPQAPIVDGPKTPQAEPTQDKGKLWDRLFG